MIIVDLLLFIHLKKINANAQKKVSATSKQLNGRKIQQT